MGEIMRLPGVRLAMHLALVVAIWLGMSWPISAGNCCAAATSWARSTPVS